MGEYFCVTCKFFDDDVRISEITFEALPTTIISADMLIWLVLDEMMLSCELTRSSIIAKTAASADVSPFSMLSHSVNYHYIGLKFSCPVYFDPISSESGNGNSTYLNP